MNSVKQINGKNVLPLFRWYNQYKKYWPKHILTFVCILIAKKLMSTLKNIMEVNILH